MPGQRTPHGPIPVVHETLRDQARGAHAPMRWSDVSIPAVVAGFLAVLVSFSGPLAIFYQAAQAAHVSPAMFASWVWGISLGAGAAGVFLSWRFRTPVITAWSAPGTALLITLFPHMSLGEAVGAYLTAALVLLLIGLSGGVDRLMAHVPKGIAIGLLACRVLHQPATPHPPRQQGDNHAADRRP